MKKLIFLLLLFTSQNCFAGVWVYIADSPTFDTYSYMRMIPAGFSYYDGPSRSWVAAPLSSSTFFSSAALTASSPYTVFSPMTSPTAGVPAPTGYFTQAQLDAAVLTASSGVPAAGGGITTMTFPFDVPLYAKLVGWFLGLFVMSFGAGTVYRLFVRNRYG